MGYRGKQRMVMGMPKRFVMDPLRHQKRGVCCSLRDLQKEVAVPWLGARNRGTEVVDEEHRQRHGVAGAKPRGFCDRLDMLLPGEATVYLHRHPLLATVEGNNGLNELVKKDIQGGEEEFLSPLTAFATKPYGIAKLPDWEIWPPQP